MIFWQGSKTKSVSVLKYNVTSQSGVVSNEVKQVIKDGVSVWAKYVGEVHVEIGEHVKWYEIIRDSSNEPDAEDIYITGDSSGEEEFSVYYGDKFHIAAQADSGYLFEDTGSEYCDDEWTVGDTPPDLTVFTYKEPEELIKPTISITQKSNGQLELKLQFWKSSSYSELHYYTLDVYAERYWDYFAQDDSQRGDEEELIEEFDENYSIENTLYNETVKPGSSRTTTRTYTFGNDIWNPGQTTWRYTITLRAAGDDSGKYKDYRVDGNIHS